MSHLIEHIYTCSPAYIMYLELYRSYKTMVSGQNLFKNIDKNTEYDSRYWYNEYHRLWERSDLLFSLLRSSEDYYKIPVDSHLPLLFYLGHLPCFSWAQFCQLDGINGVIDATYDNLFLHDANLHSCTGTVNYNYLNQFSTNNKIDKIDWHSFTVQSVIDYKYKIREKLINILFNNTLDLHQTSTISILNIVARHEMYHHETLMYLLIRLPIDSFRLDAITELDHRHHRVATSLPDNTWISLPAGQTSLVKTHYDRIPTYSFDWNNEFSNEPIYVSGFELQSHPVRNGDFLQFIIDDGYTTSDWWESNTLEWITNCNICCPLTWIPNKSSYNINFILQRNVPLESVFDHPVLVSYAEANAYCRWMSKKTGNTIDLPSESEWMYAMWDYSNCISNELTSNGCNVNFRHFHTMPVCSNNDGKLQWQGSTFEWTSNVSFATDLTLINKTFHCWCPDTYRYVFGTFRCVKRINHTDSSLTEDDRKMIIMDLNNAEHRKISSKYLYDAQGSTIYTQITQLNEYYLFRQELRLLQQRAHDIRSIILRHSNIHRYSSSTVHLIELGCGDGSKIEAWLSPWIQSKDNISAIYHPIDISQHAIDSLVHLLKKNMGKDIIEQYVKPICSTFDDMYIKLNNNTTELNVMMLFGSTIGNFDSYGCNNIKFDINAPVMKFLSQIRRNLKIGDWFVCAFDMCKDPITLIQAYSDSKGITAAFTYNLLVRLNRELNFNFNPVNYQYYATYNPLRRQIESWLISTKQQTVTDQNQFIMELQPYDVIHTEISTKYTHEDIQLLMEKNSLRIIECINTDNEQYPYTICLTQAI